MSTDIMIRINIEGGPDIELTPEQFADLCRQIDTIRNPMPAYPLNPYYPGGFPIVTCSDDWTPENGEEYSRFIKENFYK